MKLKSEEPEYEEVKEAGELPSFVYLRERPPELDARSYMIDKVHVLVSYRLEGDLPIIYEVVLHSSDVNLAREFSAVSSLLSLLFRAKVPYGIILTSLRETNDEFYNRLADVLQSFLSEFGVMEPPEEKPVKQETILTFTLAEETKEREIDESSLSVCPVCGKRTLVVDNGCYTCVNPDCGWSKCDV